MSKSFLLLKSLPKSDVSSNKHLPKKSSEWKIKSCIINPTITKEVIHCNNNPVHRKHISDNYLMDNYHRHDPSIDTIPNKTNDNDCSIEVSLIKSMKQKKSNYDIRQSLINHKKTKSNFSSQFYSKSHKSNSKVNDIGSFLSSIRPYNLQKEFKVTKVLKTTIKLKSLMNSMMDRIETSPFGEGNNEDIKPNEVSVINKNHAFTSPQLSKHEKEFKLAHMITSYNTKKQGIKINNNPLKNALIINKKIKLRKNNEDKNKNEELRQRFILPILKKNSKDIINSYKEVETVMNQIRNVYKEAKDELSNQTVNFYIES